mmetsp:Transcript_29901/g.95801  ORF Transcript_29901/g.95801 Transcript_29901/m.95801 type:complete len:87 (+) Transcript_29901:759-1019(+)
MGVRRSCNGKCHHGAMALLQRGLIVVVRCRLILESETLKKMIVEKKELTKKVQQEIKGIETERSKVQKANSFLKKQIEESAMPEVG